MTKRKIGEFLSLWIVNNNPWTLRIVSLKEFEKLSQQEQIIYLCCFGLLAPTTHNTVPQQFHITDSGLEVSLDEKYILSASDPKGRQAQVSLGCVVKNIEIAALYYGLKGNFNLRGTPSNSPPSGLRLRVEDLSGGELRFLQTERTINKSWLQVIIERRSVRAEYNPAEKLSLEIIDDMKAIITENYPSLQFHLLTEKQHIHEIAKYEEMAMRTVIEQQAFAYELGEWVLPNNDTTQERKMRGREFGFDDSFSERIHNGLLGKERLLPDEIAGFAIGGKMNMNSSSAIGVISVTNDVPKQRVDAGRALEHLWLYLHQKGYSAAIHASTTEVERVNRMLKVFLKTTNRPTIVFRMGKPLRKEDNNRPHSSRPGIESILFTQSASGL